MLYAALAGYAPGTIVALTSDFTPDKLPQHIALIFMTGGFARAYGFHGNDLRANGSSAGRRVLFVSAGAFATIVVSILGIAHG